MVFLTHGFVRSTARDLAASFSDTLEGHAGEGSGGFNVEAVSVIFASELFLIVSV